MRQALVAILRQYKLEICGWCIASEANDESPATSTTSPLPRVTLADLVLVKLEPDH